MEIRRRAAIHNHCRKQGPISKNSPEGTKQLVNALEALAVSIKRTPSLVTGSDISVGAPPLVQSPQNPLSIEEVTTTILKLREAAKAIETSDASKSCIAGLLAQVERWGSVALSGAISSIM
jgi:hypothetical protein